MNALPDASPPPGAAGAAPVAPKRRTRLLRAAGLDFHIVVTLAFRGWSVVAGVVTVLLLPHWLGPTEQGYYYTFASVLALQIFFELGLNQVVLHKVSHEVAHLTATADGRFAGDAAHLARLGSLVRLVLRWYAAAAVMFALIAGGAGAAFFDQKGVLTPSQWIGPWSTVVASTAVNLWLSPRLAIMEGCGQVGQVARLRLAQSIGGYALLWILLLAGAGLWATAAVPLSAAAATAYWQRYRGRLLAWLAGQPADDANLFRWKTDLLPLQWRIAISWISGYFIFNLFTPLVFARSGAVEAGRLGMGLTMFAAISSIGMSWVNAKAPVFTMHVSRHERHELNSLFRTVASRSIAATAASAMLIVATAWVLWVTGEPMMARIASPDVLTCLAVVTVANSAVFAAASYMRAHLEEPMLPVSVVSAGLTAAAALIGSRFGTLPMVTLYLIVTLCVSVPWTLWLFAGYWKRAR